MQLNYTGENVLRGYMEAQTTVDYALWPTIRNLSASHMAPLTST